MLLAPLRTSGTNGFTLLETSVAVGFVGIFIAILIVMSSSVLGMLRTSKDNISASQNLQQRVEQLRLVSWGQVTDVESVAEDILSVPTPSAAGLSAPIETMVISPYPPKAGYVPGKVVCTNGVPTVVSANPQLRDELMVRVDVTLSWKGHPQKRDRARAASILIAQGGPSK